MLYNLTTDPTQDRNLADAHPEVAQHMGEAYEAWWKKVRPDLINEQQPGQ